MFKVSKNIIFCPNDNFIINRLVNSLISKGMDLTEVHSKEENTPLTLFLDDVFTTPLVGNCRLGIIFLEEELESAFFEKIINSIPSSSYLIFKFDRIPMRASKLMKDNIQYRTQLDDEECSQLLTAHLSILGKKISANSKKFLISKLEENIEKSLSVLDKLASFTSSLYIDENQIKASFEANLSTYEIPEAFFNSKGLDCIKILSQTDFTSFKGLYKKYLETLIKFKLAEDKSISEKFRIIKAHPDVIRKFESQVKFHSLPELEKKFIHFNLTCDLDQSIFLIKHLSFK